MKEQQLFSHSGITFGSEDSKGIPAYLRIGGIKMFPISASRRPFEKFISDFIDK